MNEEHFGDQPIQASVMEESDEQDYDTFVKVDDDDETDDDIQINNNRLQNFKSTILFYHIPHLI